MDFLLSLFPESLSILVVVVAALAFLAFALYCLKVVSSGKGKLMPFLGVAGVLIVLWIL